MDGELEAHTFIHAPSGHGTHPNCSMLAMKRQLSKGLGNGTEKEPEGPYRPPNASTKLDARGHTKVEFATLTLPPSVTTTCTHGHRMRDHDRYNS